MTAVTNYGLLLLGVATSVIAARLLGPTGRGELAAIQLWPLQLSNIALLGLPEALVYFSSRWERELGGAMTTAVALGLAAAGVLALAAYVAMPVLLASQAPWVVAASRVYLLMTVLLVGTLPYHILRGRSMFLSWNIFRAMPPLAWLAVLAFSLVLAVRDPVFLTRANLVVTAVLIIPFVLIARRAAPPPYRPQRKHVRPLLAFGLPNVLAVLPQTLNLRLDQILLAAFVGADKLGLYVTAVAWSAAITPAVAAIAHVNFPRIADVSNSDRVGVLARGVRLSVLVGCSTGAMLFCITPYALPLIFGDSFRDATPVALLLIIASAIAGCNYVLQDSLRGLGRPGLVFRSEIVGLLVTGAGLAILLRPLSLIGAALASILGYSTVFVVLVRVTTAATGLGVAQLIVPTSADLRQLWHALSSASRVACRRLKIRG